MAEIFGNTTATPLNPNAFSGGGSTPTKIQAEGEVEGMAFCPTVEAQVAENGSSIRVYDEMLGNIPLYGIDTTGREPTEAVSVEFLNSKIGDIETAIDNIIAIQNSLIGGNE